MNLEWRNLSFSVPKEDKKWWKFFSKTNNASQRCILNNGNFHKFG